MQKLDKGKDNKSTKRDECKVQRKNKLGEGNNQMIELLNEP
jgi:hypothetical protein